MKLDRWQPEEFEALRQRYPHVPTADLAREMGRTLRAVYKRAHELGLHKTSECLSGNTTKAERFWAKVDKEGPIHPKLGTRCWVWMASRFPDGYGQFGSGPSRSASRIAWELVRGPVPDGLFVLHKCDNPPCVNPEHLFLGTQKDNARDAAAKGRLSNPPGYRRSHCLKGHPFTAENTLNLNAGTRTCKTCKRDREARDRKAGRWKAA